MSERERIAKIILRHKYSTMYGGVCLCSREVRRTEREHAIHVADRIQSRREP